ncbi:MAG: hypothetical protein KGM49_04780 [Sphingomonadales bacterium]|nr:hypothetical protein [Sphingomonadales bacterium]
MIATSNADGVFARLAARAEALAEAIAAERQQARSDPARRWRQAVMLWPLFTKG